MRDRWHTNILGSPWMLAIPARKYKYVSYTIMVASESANITLIFSVQLRRDLNLVAMYVPLAHPRRHSYGEVYGELVLHPDLSAGLPSTVCTTSNVTIHMCTNAPYRWTHISNIWSLSPHSSIVI